MVSQHVKDPADELLEIFRLFDILKVFILLRILFLGLLSILVRLLHVVYFLSSLLFLKTTLRLFVVEYHETDLRELHTGLYRLFEVILHRGQVVATCYVEEPVLLGVLGHEIVCMMIEEEIPEAGLPGVIEVLLLEAGHYA